MERRVTRSTSNTRRDPEETEGEYWGRVIDPSTIERGQAEAIRTVRHATSIYEVLIITSDLLKNHKLNWHSSSQWGNGSSKGPRLD